METKEEPRRLRIEHGAAGIVVQPAVNLPKRAADLVPDYALLQQEARQYLPVEAMAVAEARDADHPLWSIMHGYRHASLKSKAGPAWYVDWENIRRFYLFSDISMRDLAELSDVPLRTMEQRAAQHQWTTAKKQYLALRARELAAPSLAEMEVEARKQMVEETLMEWGLELGQRAIAGLANVDVTKINARDLPMMLQTARDLMAMANKMPSSYKHSQTKVERGDDPHPTINILNMPPGEAAAKAQELIERLKTIEQARAALPVPIDVKP